MDDEKKIQKKSLIDFERPRLDAPLYVENPSPHGFGMDPNDGLPRPAIMSSFEDTEAADLTPERFVCMAKEGVTRLTIFGRKTKGGREQCKHYRRQLLPSSDKERKVGMRYCTAVVSAGEMTDLANTEVLACEFRDPRDPESEKQLEDFDNVIMERQRQRDEDEKPFDPEAALEEQK